MGPQQYKRATELFLAACELAVQDRLPFLERECGGDCELRIIVEQMLAEDSHSLPVPSIRIPVSTSEDTIDSTPVRGGTAGLQSALARGARIGPYMLEQKIGEGGFGAVWKARQHEPVKRLVALKIIKLGMDTRQVIARFEAERQALAMMNHPGIARVYDAGSTDTGRPYFVMEYIEGVPIVDFCDREAFGMEARLNLFVRVCEALQHAHQKGIIHRDIKPSNVLITMEDGSAAPKIIDFGIAKATEQKLTEHTMQTEFGQFIGTPAYMSPEQADPFIQDIDTRSDIYSLGVLLYELLTGTTPFGIKTLSGLPIEEIKRIIREAEPPKPSTRLSTLGADLDTVARQRSIEPRKLTSLLRGDLDTIIIKALEKDRTHRYETANGLAMDIKRYLRNEPIVAAPPSGSYRLRKFVRRNRALVTAVSVVAAVLVLGVIGTTWGLVWALDEKARANDAATKAKLAAQAEFEAKQQAEDAAKAALLAADTAEREAYHAQLISAELAIEEQRLPAARKLLAATPPRLRGWEYRHLSSRLDRSLPSPLSGAWKLWSGVASRDASYLVVRRMADEHSEGEWIVVDPESGTERSVVAHKFVRNLAIAPDGSRIVGDSAPDGDEKAIALWDVDSQQLLWSMPYTGVRTFRFSWDRSGQRFLVSQHEHLDIRDAYTGALLKRISADHSSSAGWYGALFTSDERWILTWLDRSIQLIDAQSGQAQPAVLELKSPSTIGPIAFDLQGRFVAAGMIDGTVRLLELKDGTLHEQATLTARTGVALTCVVFSQDGRLLATGDEQGQIRVWEVASGAQRCDFTVAEASISGLVFLKESGHLLSFNEGGQHQMWPVSRSSSGVLGHRSFVYPAVLSADGSLLLSGGWDGATGYSGGLKFWDARTGALVAEYGQPGDIFFSADRTPDGRYAVLGVYSESNAAKRTEVLDLLTGTVRTTFRASWATSQPERIVVHPDGHRVLSTYRWGEAFVWDLFTGNLLWETNLGVKPDHNWDAHGAAAISHDGRILALSDRELGIRLVDAERYEDIGRWDAHEERIWSLAFSPDSKWLLSASEDDTVGVWEVATGHRIAQLVGHGVDVLCAAISPDGTRIASGGRDGYVRLWDTTHFEQVAQLGGHESYIYSLTWSPDGAQLVSSSGDGTVRLWETRSLAEQLTASRRRIEALPGIEAQFAKALADGLDPATAVETVSAQMQLDARGRELLRQVALGYACRSAPAYYRAPRTTEPILIDGYIDETAWTTAPWTSEFVDIEGADKPAPRHSTRARLVWDAQYLYVAAWLAEPDVWGTLTEHDAVIFRDNDFEVFLDPEGDSRWYSEIEVNALGTIFDLQLDRPYREGGKAHIDWSPAGLRAAIAVDGTINDPADVDRGWTVEMAIPLAAVAEHSSNVLPPRPGDVWRLNFSRVQWQHDVVDGCYVKRPDTPENNWVWTPQHMVNMHRPRMWGFLEFAQDESGEESETTP